MEKKMKFFKQHTPKTCGASCILMLLDYYHKILYASRKLEMEIYNMFRCRAKTEPDGEEYGGITGAAIASCLSAKSLSVHLVHSSSNYMDNKNGYFTQFLYEGMLEEYRQELELCKGRIRHTEGVEITAQTIREELEKDRQVILETFIPGDADGIHTKVLHWVLVYGYQHKDNRFLVFDPGYGKIPMTPEELEGYMDTPIGKIYLSVSGAWSEWCKDAKQAEQDHK